MRLFHLTSLCFLLLLLISAPPAQAQPSDDEVPLLRGSNRALIFTIDQLSLGSVNGGVGMRWWLSQSAAVRVSFTLNVESIEDVVQESADRGRSAFGAGTSVLIEWHSQQFRRVSPYISAGGGVAFDAFSETTDFTATNPLRRQRDKGSVLDFSIDAGLGAEVYLTRSISLSGEHLFSASVRQAESTLIDEPRAGPEVERKRDSTAFRFGTGTSRLILSVFF